MSERHEVIINNIVYIFRFSGKSISFYVDPLKSKTHVEILPEEWELDSWHDFSEPPPPIKLYRRVPMDAPIKVYAEAIKFAKMCIGKYKPTAFTFSAQEKERIPLYSRVAKKLANQFGYHLYEEPQPEDAMLYQFYKII